jgi:hypothetical protein
MLGSFIFIRGFFHQGLQPEGCNNTPIPEPLRALFNIGRLQSSRVTEMPSRGSVRRRSEAIAPPEEVAAGKKLLPFLFSSLQKRENVEASQIA